MLYDIDGTGERGYIASAYTMMIYEQEFHKSLIADVYGKIELDTGGGSAQVVSADFVRERLSSALPEGKELPKTTSALIDKAFPAVEVKSIDYTRDNWESYLRCMWAMARTADKAGEGAGDPVPSDYGKWLAGLGPVNLAEISNVVARETRRGLFRATDGGDGADGDE